MIKILIADDHAIVRQGLKQICRDISDIIVAAEASNSTDVLHHIRRHDFDVVILDISMPGMNGLDLLKRLKAEKPDIAVLILTVHPEEQYAMRAMRAGASGYLTKESAPEELIQAIRTVSRGKKYLTSTLGEKLALMIETGAKSRHHENLSDREYQVMCMIAKGKTLKEIAENLSLSIKTVSTYRSRVLEKMDMKSNAQLAYYAIKNGLVE